jgi:hypothetical protein
MRQSCDSNAIQAVAPMTLRNLPLGWSHENALELRNQGALRPYFARMRLFFGLCSSSLRPSASISGGM